MSMSHQVIPKSITVSSLIKIIVRKFKNLRNNRISYKCTLHTYGIYVTRASQIDIHITILIVVTSVWC